MPRHTESQILPYSTQQIFDLVADVARYSEFLPWCRASRVLDRNGNEFLGELVISYKGITESYTSRVTLTPPDAEGDAAIDVVMVKGPFHHLTNKWRLSPDPSGCHVDFALDFAFRSRLLEGLIGGFFTKATAHMIDAFKTRAEALYGKKSL